MKHEPLSRPPIVEALLDFRVPPVVPEAESGARLGKIAELLRDEYPEQREVSRRGVPGTGLLSHLVKEGNSPSDLRLRTADGRRTLLVGRERLTVSVVFDPGDTPYTKWEDLCDPAFAAWAVYQENASPTALAALATRFVNRFEVPFDQIRMVFLQPPELPVQDASLLAFQDRRGGLTTDLFGVRVERRLEATAPARPAKIFFDVEAFRVYTSNALLPPIGREHLEQDLNRLRELKNSLFYESLTFVTLDRFRNARD